MPRFTERDAPDPECHDCGGLLDCDEDGAYCPRCDDDDDDDDDARAVEGIGALLGAVSTPRESGPGDYYDRKRAEASRLSAELAEVQRALHRCKTPEESDEQRRKCKRLLERLELARYVGD